HLRHPAADLHDHGAEPRVELIRQIAEIYGIQGFETRILAASIRNGKHIVDAALAGADVVTCPLSSILGLLKHPLTDIGLEQFLADHRKAEAVSK
ncbi:MAG TPA: transaldolase family protein, partial [Saprospiraceae bacterium]|nr:transaldolase family protein [Saprospiraceae bacterium]